MSPARQADPELDNLIDEITVDCHDDRRTTHGLRSAFDEDANFPCPGTVVGEDSRGSLRQPPTTTAAN